MQPQSDEEPPEAAFSSHSTNSKHKKSSVKEDSQPLLAPEANDEPSQSSSAQSSHTSFIYDIPAAVASEFRKEMQRVAEWRSRRRRAMTLYRRSVFKRVSIWCGIICGVLGLILILLGSTIVVSWPVFFNSENKDIPADQVNGVIEMNPGYPATINGTLTNYGDTATYKWTIPPGMDTSALQIGLCVDGPIIAYCKEGSIPSTKDDNRPISWGSWDFNCTVTANKLSHYQCDLDFDATKQWNFYFVFMSYLQNGIASYQVVLQPCASLLCTHFNLKVAGVEYCDESDILGVRMQIFLWIIGFCCAGAFFLAMCIVIVIYWLCTNATYRADNLYYINS